MRSSKPNNNESVTQTMTSSPIKLMIAVPTYNRLEKLKILLKSLEAQLADDSFTCMLVISNSESIDGTFEFIEKLEPFGAIREIIKHNKRANPNEPRPDNWHALYETIPNNGGWVWLLGDDDYLVSPNSFKSLASIIKRYDSRSVKLIHLTQARRSKGSKLVSQLNLVDAVNSFGFLELLGWMSSIVARAEVIHDVTRVAFFDPGEDPSDIGPKSGNLILDTKWSAFRHSAQFLKLCCRDEIIIVDDYYAEPQDDAQTPDSIRRWEADGMGLRYMFVVDDVEYLRKKGLIRDRLSAVFFRYHTQFLWDRFTHYVVAHLVQAGELDDYCLAFMERLVRIELMLWQPSEIHLFRLWRTCFFNAVEDSVKARQRYLESCDKLDQLVRLSFKGVYSFDTFQ